MDGSGITPVMSMNPGYGDGFGFGGSGLWLFAILALMWGGNGFFGGNNLGYRPATAEDVNNGFNFSELQSENRDILSTISAGTAQAVAATNQAKYDNINVAKDIQSSINSTLGEIKVAQAEALANQNRCCCETLRAIDATNYNTTAQIQKVLDAISANKISELEAKVGQLELAQATANVVRYPTSATFGAGPAFGPFFGPTSCGNI